MKITKYFSVVVLVLLGLLLTTFTFAYWAGSINGATIEDYTNTIEIGAGKEVNTELVLSDKGVFSEGSLVPKGYESTEYKYVSELTTNVKLKWTASEGAIGASGKLSVFANDLGFPDLFNVDLTYPENVVLDEEVTVKVTVSFNNEPKDKTQYDKLMQEKPLTLKLTFGIEAE